MPKSIAVSASHTLAPSGADAGLSVGIVGALLQQYNALRKLSENAPYTAAGVAMATTTTKAKTANTLTYTIDGKLLSKAGTDNFWTLSGSVVPDGSRCVFLLYIDSAGAASVVQGPIGTTDAAATVPADTLVESKCLVATLKVVCSGTTFTPGTDNLNKASVTFTFSDGYDGTLVGACAITTVN